MFRFRLSLTWFVAVVAAVGAVTVGSPQVAHAGAPASVSLSFQLRSTTCTRAVAQGPSGITSVAATGDLAYNICIYVEDRATGLGVDGVPVEVRTIVGTVGASGTSRYSGILFTAGGGITTISYRGDGKTFGGDTAVATYPGGNAAGTATITLTPPLGRFPTRIAVTTPQTSSIAAISTATGTSYVSTAPGTDLALQVQDAEGRGVNGEILLVQSEQARLVANPGFALTAAAACTGATTQALVLTTATDRTLREGLSIPGTVDLAICAIPDRAPTEVVVTAQAITKPLPDATVRLRHVARPYAVDARFDGTTIEAVVTDADHNPVADDTPVQIVVPTLAGTVATSCLLTREGRVTTTVALSLPVATAIVVASYQEQGAAATCVAPGTRLVVTALPLARVP
jgi:hypothetical protein